MRRNQLIATAYHEAGHAVISRLTTPRISVRRVSIIADERQGTLGHVLHRKPHKSFQPDAVVTPSTRERLEANIIATLAGDIAERKFTGRKTNGWCRDFDAACSLASCMVSGERELEAYINWQGIRTEAMLDFPPFWGCVEVVAERLLTQQRLTCKDVERTMQDALRK